ncbi:class I SAM-dependent methyltransferase [Pseudosulfitobacter koreensis]|uniref:Class I SAM-dependent methyltransferase n=1 Tax=Pseudosulfitobacter koreensis TaxID=2968472 RepID=A0ABT1Z474_9RHOB|nr:class I SAM-dependent methyltransferase [Pseudosulfitobacter koreense]MCR8827929.1 class I SAM-dependent methyltransferase [Pseudosulfitobacter koreense]
MKSHDLNATVFETASQAKDALERHKTAGQAPTAASANLPDAPTGTFGEMAEDLSHILDTSHFFLTGERDAGHVVECLVLQLHDLRSECTPEVWKALIPMAQAHPIRERLMADPFTRRSFEKPRGYSGDGVLLDLLYRHPAAKAEVDASSKMGRDIYAHTSISESSCAVQERREILARYVDKAATRRPGAEILTVASGHLREAEFSAALAKQKLSRWVALDQDEANLAVVAKEFAGTVVAPVSGSIKGLMMQQYDLGSFDLVYSAGVYDYLPFEIAVALTRRLLDSVHPGGTLLFGNFSTEVVPDGYMETFMNWSLIFRDQAQMRDIVDAATADTEAQAELFFGQNRHIIYAQITKAA